MSALPPGSGNDSSFKTPLCCCSTRSQAPFSNRNTPQPIEKPQPAGTATVAAIPSLPGPKNGPQTTLLIGVRFLIGSTSKPAAVAAADAAPVEQVAAAAI